MSLPDLIEALESAACAARADGLNVEGAAKHKRLERAAHRDCVAPEFRVAAQTALKRKDTEAHGRACGLHQIEFGPDLKSLGERLLYEAKHGRPAKGIPRYLELVRRCSHGH